MTICPMLLLCLDQNNGANASIFLLLRAGGFTTPPEPEDPAYLTSATPPYSPLPSNLLLIPNPLSSFTLIPRFLILHTEYFPSSSYSLSSSLTHFALLFSFSSLTQISLNPPIPFLFPHTDSILPSSFPPSGSTPLSSSSSLTNSTLSFAFLPSNSSFSLLFLFLYTKSTLSSSSSSLKTQLFCLPLPSDFTFLFFFFT